MDILHQPTQRRVFYIQLTKLAVPVALQSMLMSMLSIIDVFMVGRLGDQAIAAVGLSGRLHFLALVIIAGMTSSCCVLMSQYWGRRDVDICRSVMALTIFAGLILLVPVTLLVFSCASDMLSLATTDVGVISLGTDYLIWSAPVLLLTHAVVVLEGGLRSIGQTVSPLVISMFTVLANVVLNFALIGGRWGAPEMGVAGAALGTDIARFLQLAILLGLLYLKHQHPLQLNAVDFKLVTWLKISKQYVELLMPITLHLLLWSVGSLGYHLIASKMGTAPLAAISLIAPIESLYYALFIGICSACAIMIGHRLGRSAFLEAKHLAGFFIHTGPRLAMVLGIVLVFAREFVLGLFGHLDQHTLELANVLYIIMALTFWIKVLNFTLIHAILRAGGDNRFCMINDFVSMWLLGLPISAFGAFVLGLGYPAVYSLALVEEVVKGIFAYRRVRGGSWLRNLTQVHG